MKKKIYPILYINKQLKLVSNVSFPVRLSLRFPIKYDSIFGEIYTNHQVL